jgi:hypothetical protein
LTRTTRRAERARENPAVENGITTRMRAQWLATVMCTVGLLAGCSSGPSLNPDSPTGVNLAGSWKLNRQASADPEAMIHAIVEKELRHMRRRSHTYEDDPDTLPPPGGGPGANGRTPDNIVPPNGMFRPREGMAAYLRSHYTNALGSLLSGESLVIEQSPDRFALRRGDSQRSFTPGGRSVIGVTGGVADQTTGWKGRDYVIDVRPQVGPRVTERYGLGPDGQLIERVSLSGDDDLPKLEFTRVYDKGAPASRGLPH